MKKALKSLALNRSSSPKTPKTRKEIQAEYQSLVAKKETKTAKAGLQSDNRSKNRYMDVLPYDSTRVVLKEAEDGDYINASHITFKDCPKCKYIACQGPTDSTIEHFWLMVWEQKCVTIVMLANEVEASRKKVSRYWPTSESTPNTYGKLSVVHLSETPASANSSHVVRDLELTWLETNEKRRVRQFHYHNWPDFDVPFSAQPLTEFMSEVHAWNDDYCTDIVAHCSAGIGRTGTYICVDYGLQLASQGSTVDVYSIVKDMRQQRPGMIQTPEQYEFCYTALSLT
eukprot:CFRG7375T1